MKVLFYTHFNVDYGLDTLYDGLCRVLGHENVFEYPTKDTLHGSIVEKYSHFPMYFDYPIKASDYKKMLEDNEFDLILVSSRINRDEFFDTVIEKSKEIPTFIVDMDDFNGIETDLFEEVNARLYFKRECYKDLIYDSRVVPLSFSYSEKYIPDINVDKPNFIFWAGRGYSKRYRYLDAVKELVKDLPSIIYRTEHRKIIYSQKEYSRNMLSSKVALNFKGYGWDTIRYYEIPAHGTLLFSRFLPICVENDFTDGHNAVFFNDIEEMKEKLTFLINNPNYVDKIRIRGYEHFMKYHTSTKRAEQMLDKIRGTV